MAAPTRDRIIAGSATALILGGAGALLVTAFDVPVGRMREAVLAMVDIHEPPPPPPVQEQPVKPTSRAKGAPSPPNLRNRATDIVPPKPALVVPAPPLPVVAAPAPDTALAANTGASDRAGPGRGAGGAGDGDGGGGDGGDGDGTPPRQIRGRLSMNDLPPALRQTGWSGRVDVRYRVDVDGRVGGCSIDRSSGQPEVDALTCRLITERFRFKPSLDGAGRPVRSVIVESHEWIVERDRSRD